MNLPPADSLLAWRANARARAAGVALLDTLEIARVRRILLVLTTGLGDAVLSSAVIPNVRRALPQARVALFVRAAWSGLFAADPDIDEVIPYAGKYRSFFPTLAALKRFAPELAVVLHGNDPDIIPMMTLAGARHVVRVPTQGTRFTHLLANRERREDRRTVAGLHYVDNRLRVLDTIGVPVVSRAPRIARPGEENPMAGRGRYWVFHPFAADPYKTWPAAPAREFLARALAAHPSASIAITGGESDREAASALAAGLGLGRLELLAGRLSIAGTAAVLAGADCVVAPDTGILHLAAALDRPVVGLYAPTSAALVGPRAASAAVIALQQPPTCRPCLEKRCPYTPENCMTQIGVDEVLAALARQLDPGIRP